MNYLNQFRKMSILDRYKNNAIMNPLAIMLIMGLLSYLSVELATANSLPTGFLWYNRLLSKLVKVVQNYC
ncbi:conjugal transfer protein [Orientia tsutsugamushi]|nr:conjugal transfer protein [Orientia tsutsugamushi]